MWSSRKLVVVLCSVSLCQAPSDTVAQESEPPQITVGDALFLKTRFTVLFHRHASGVNEPLAEGDPVMNATAAISGDLFGSFRGKNMNYRACHFVDEHAEFVDKLDAPQGVMRSYADFA